MTALAFVGYLIGWFVVAVVLARRDVMRVVECHPHCQRRTYSWHDHTTECENRMVPVSPGMACLVALAWPGVLGYLAVDYAGSYQRKTKTFDVERVRKLEKELGMDR